MSDPETIFVHNDKDEELKNDEQKNISRIANKRVESAKNDGKDIELGIHNNPLMNTDYVQTGCQEK